MLTLTETWHKNGGNLLLSISLCTTAAVCSLWYFSAGIVIDQNTTYRPSIKSLLATADVGVYKAKNAGRNISITDFVDPKQPEIE